MKIEESYVKRVSREEGEGGEEGEGEGTPACGLARWPNPRSAPVPGRSNVYRATAREYLTPSFLASLLRPRMAALLHSFYARNSRIFPAFVRLSSDKFAYDRLSPLNWENYLWREAVGAARSSVSEKKTGPDSQGMTERPGEFSNLVQQ